MLKHCILQKYRLPAELKYQEFLKSKAEQEQKVSKISDEHINMLKTMNYTQIFVAGPSANLNTYLLETIKEDHPMLSK